MTRLLEERAKAGIEVRIIGKVTRKTNGAGAAQAEWHASAHPDHHP